MKHMHTPSHTFMAVRFETTGSVDRKPFDVVKKLSIVVTPANRSSPVSVNVPSHSGRARLQPTPPPPHAGVYANFFGAVVPCNGSGAPSFLRGPSPARLFPPFGRRALLKVKGAVDEARIAPLLLREIYSAGVCRLLFYTETGLSALLPLYPRRGRCRFVDISGS